MLFEQIEVVQSVAVQGVQAGAQAVADDGPGPSAGRCGPRRRGVLGCRIMGSARQHAGRQPGHGVGKCRLPHLNKDQ